MGFGEAWCAANESEEVMEFEALDYDTCLELLGVGWLEWHFQEYDFLLAQQNISFSA